MTIKAFKSEKKFGSDIVFLQREGRVNVGGWGGGRVNVRRGVA